MRARTKAMVALMLAVAGLITAGLLAASDARQQRPSESRLPTVPVAVATRDIPLGAVVSDADVRIMQWPASVVPPNHAATAAEVAGRAVLAPIKKDEPLLEHRLSPKGTGSGLPVLIAEGSRALSVRVEDVVGIAGFVQPGSRVDVLVTARSNEDARSGILLQGVRVLATGHQLNASSDSSQNSAVITLEVTPPQAELLTLASAEGRIQLALRNPLDNASTPTDGVRMTELVPGYHQPAAPASLGASFQRSQTASASPKSAPKASLARRTGGTNVEVFSGGSRAVTTVQDSVH